jgi:dTDP-4-dehydrorhamnose reductase
MVTGAGGQLARALIARAPPRALMTALSSRDLDVSDAVAVSAAVRREKPEIIFNAAAYTAVDHAQTEADRAFAVNRDGPAALAAASREAGARLVHISTDFVFDGLLGRPYRPEDEARPLGVYGASKRAGEEAVAAALPEALIVRTAWVYSPHGHNFVRTMLRIMATRGEARVVADQIGAPTSAANLADALWRLDAGGAQGVYHYTDAGVASWYDFAQAIAEEARGLNMLGAVRVQPITTADYPTPAPRPSFSVLDCTKTWDLLGVPAPHWRTALREVLAILHATAQSDRAARHEGPRQDHGQ